MNNTLLVLDHVNANLYASNTAYYRFLEIIKSINDFCPGIYIIIIARQPPLYISSDSYVKLFPLDGSEVTSYVNHHPGVVHELQNADNLFKLIEITSGLPKHIDRIIDSLKVASFEDLLESEKEWPVDMVNVDQIPKSLKRAISNLAESPDKLKLRSFKLLKILTILANGETIGNLKRFDGTEPIYIQNANELEQLSLMEVVTTTKVLPKVTQNLTQQIKILRVPRQIRDYVNTLITDDEKDTIVKNACEMYFGNKWRQGTIKDIYSSSSVFETSKFFNVDNCHLITNSLMANAIRDCNEHEIERAAHLVVNFCNHIHTHGDYKNAVDTLEEIYGWLRSTNFNRIKATNAKLLGEALRMAGNMERSNQILNEALEIKGGNFSKDEKNSIYIELGFTYIKQGKFEKAIECANAIEKTAAKKNAHSLQAKFIRIQALFKDEELVKKLKSLESEAKKADIPTLVNTISLAIAGLEKDSIEKEKRFSTILASKGEYYNKVRAIIAKSVDSLINGSGSISEEDFYFLNLSYSYLYSQRIEGMFKSCHMALWTFCVNEKRSEELLNLFKHSSLIWRISGEIELEKKYFLELKEIVSDQIKNIGRDPINVANINYYTRRKLEFDTQLVTE